jgi:hypothetical protein
MRDIFPRSRFGLVRLALRVDEFSNRRSLRNLVNLMPRDRSLRSLLTRGLLAVVCTGTLLASQASACPMCKLAVQEDDPQPRAYMISILFMLFMITAVIGTFGLLLVWVNRAEKRAIADAGYQHLLQNGVNQVPAAGLEPN